MKLRLVLLSLLSAWFVARPAQAAAVPLINLVGDDTSLVIYIPDAPALVKSWPGTPWMKTWHDDQVQKYFAPLRAQFKMDEWDDQAKTATGYTVAGLLDFATGEAILVLPDLGTVIDAAKNKADPPVLIAIEVGDNAAKIEKLIATAEAKDAEKNEIETTEGFDGVTVHIRGAATPNGATPPHPDIWAIAGGVLYASPSKDLLEQALAAAKQGGHDNPLGKSDGFMQMRQRNADAQVIFYANIKAMYPAAQKAIAVQQAQGAGKANPMAFDPAAILTGLGLDTDNELYLTATIGETGTDLNFGLTYSERRGLAKLFAYADGAPPQPQFVPAKCFSVASARFSIKNFYASLDEMLGNISPFLSGMFQVYVKNFNDRLGIDIKRDLIGNFGDQVIVATALNDAAPDDAPVNERISQFYAVSLENATALTTAIESIKHGLFGESADKFFEKRAYLGHDIYTYAPPQPPAAEGAPASPAARGFSYAVTDQWFFLGIGSAALVENALQGLDGKQASFWDKDEVKRNLLASVPDNARGFSYVDLSKVIPLYFDLAVQGMETSRKMAAMRAAQKNQDDQPAGGVVEPSKPFIDDSAKPDAATLAKYWDYSRGYFYQDANGTYSTTHIANPNNP
ncbi:MAG TPA: hypothetical protein VNW23_00090 [Opitutaceae bacterium]|jgi:hypothetical protein|nr:hypothetical protein [Opitutaceae bacterium]